MIKQWRDELENIHQNVKSLPDNRERLICVEKIQEAMFWLGMDLRLMENFNPYPDSYKPK